VPKPVPKATPVSRPFWDAAAVGELHIQRCSGCGEHVFYPRRFCPHCGSPDLAWVRAGGRAVLDSYVISHVPGPGFADEVPYVIAIVRLEEGPRMLSRLAGVAPDPAVLELDMPLLVGFEPRGEMAVPVFHPAEAVHSAVDSAVHAVVRPAGDAA
jgi:uncharacterized OB-fold protein